MTEPKLTNESLNLLSTFAGKTLSSMSALEEGALSGWVLIEFNNQELFVLAPESCSGFENYSGAEYFRLNIGATSEEPQIERWPSGPLHQWGTLSGIPPGALPAIVLSARPILGDWDLGTGEVGVEISLNSGFRLEIIADARELLPLALGINWYRV